MHFADLTAYTYWFGGDLFHDKTSPIGYCLGIPESYQRLNVG